MEFISASYHKENVANVHNVLRTSCSTHFNLKSSASGKDNATKVISFSSTDSLRYVNLIGDDGQSSSADSVFFCFQVCILQRMKVIDRGGVTSHIIFRIFRLI